MRELHFNTPEQVGQYVRQTLKIIDKANVPEDLRQGLAVAVLQLLAAKNVALEQADVSPVQVAQGILRH